MKPTLRTAVVRFTFEGWHHWPGATDERAYLGHSHRHLFHVEVSVQTFHDEREVEFHDLLAHARSASPSFGQSDLGGMSCESMAQRIADRLADFYPGRALEVSVFEDGEVGATLMFDPEDA